jgi:ankyrin repeat protein
MSDALFDAIRTGDIRRVESLLAVNPTLVVARHDGTSAALYARYCGRHDIVGLLRIRLPALDVFEASGLGDAERLAVLLSKDPTRANAVAEDGFGPLGLASHFDQEPCVRLLLAHGARVDAASQNRMCVMPLHSAAAAHSVPIARLLLAHGAPVDARQGTGPAGFTPLMEAAHNGQIEMIRLLLEHGADRGLRDAEGMTAADHAAKAGHAEAAALCR